jgi:hypothetical protein
VAQESDRTALLGFAYELSPSLVALTCRARHPDMPASAYPKRPLKLGYRDDGPADRPVEKLIAGHDVSRIILVYTGRSPNSSAKDAEMQEPAAAALTAEGALVEERSVPASGYRIVIFRRSADARHVGRTGL